MSRSHTITAWIVTLRVKVKFAASSFNVLGSGSQFECLDRLLPGLLMYAWYKRNMHVSWMTLHEKWL